MSKTLIDVSDEKQICNDCIGCRSFYRPNELIICPIYHKHDSIEVCGYKNTIQSFLKMSNLSKKQYKRKDDFIILEEYKDVMYSLFSTVAYILEDKYNHIDNIILTGTSFVGKTMWAIKMLQMFIVRYASNYINYIFDDKPLGLFVNELSLQRQYKDNFNGLASPSFKKLYKDIFECPLLVLDDFCLLASDFDTLFIYDILNTRVNNGLKTIITTNKPKLELKNVYGERIYNRLMETGIVYHIKDYKKLNKVSSKDYDYNSDFK